MLREHPASLSHEPLEVKGASGACAAMCNAGSASQAGTPAPALPWGAQRVPRSRSTGAPQPLPFTQPSAPLGPFGAAVQPPTTAQRVPRRWAPCDRAGRMPPQPWGTLSAPPRSPTAPFAALPNLLAWEGHEGGMNSSGSGLPCLRQQQRMTNDLKPQYRSHSALITQDTPLNN